MTKSELKNEIEKIRDKIGKPKTFENISILDKESEYESNILENEYNNQENSLEDSLMDMFS